MRKLLLVTLLSLTTLSGCLSTQPKSYEDKGYSVAKQKLVSLGAPQDYITDGKTPLEAKFEGQSRMDAISRHAGLATAVSTLSITSTFMATMASSDVDDRTIWKKYLANPIVFIEHGEEMSIQKKRNLFSDFALTNGFFLDERTGVYSKENKKFNLEYTSKPVVQSGNKVYFVRIFLVDDKTFQDENEILKQFFIHSHNKHDLKMYVPASNGEPAYIIDKGQKHYFVAQK